MRTRKYPAPYPLDQFPPEERARIEALASGPKPPPKYLTFHDEGGRPMCQMASRAWYEWHFRRSGKDPRNRRPSLSSTLRAQVIARDGLVCAICRGEVAETDVHIDHIRPVARGGKDALSNLQVTHSECNIRKGAQWPG